MEGDQHDETCNSIRQLLKINNKYKEENKRNHNVLTPDFEGNPDIEDMQVDVKVNSDSYKIYIVSSASTTDIENKIKPCLVKQYKHTIRQGLCTIEFMVKKNIRFETIWDEIKAIVNKSKICALTK